MKHCLQYELVYEPLGGLQINDRGIAKLMIILLNLRFIFLNQPVGDKAKQEDQSKEGSHGNRGQNDAEHFEVQSRNLRRQVVFVGFPDVSEQN